MTDPFARMHDRIHARLGAQDSTIRGAAATRPIVIEYGVAVTGEYGEIVTHRDVAVISQSDTPAAGDSIVAGGKTYVLDSLLEYNGHDARWVVR